MQLDKAKALRAGWKGTSCDHPEIVKEYYLGTSTGDKVCTTCGEVIDENGKVYNDNIKTEKSMNENYNNSAEGNEMRKWIEKVKNEEKKYILIPIEDIENLWAVANSGSEAENDETFRLNFVGQAKLIKHLYENYGKVADEVTRVIAE